MPFFRTTHAKDLSLCVAAALATARAQTVADAVRLNVFSRRPVIRSLCMKVVRRLRVLPRSDPREFQMQSARRHHPIHSIALTITQRLARTRSGPAGQPSRLREDLSGEREKCRQPDSCAVPYRLLRL